MKRKTIIFAIAIFIFFGCSNHQAYAWGPLTHASLAFDALENSGSSLSDDLMGAYLAGTLEPDVSVELGGNLSEHANVYQDPDFIKAMINVAQTKKSPEKELLMARAQGYSVHLLTDSVAHEANSKSTDKRGYPNSKKVFDNSGSHGAVELCVDLIKYRKENYQAKIDGIKLNYIDTDTLIEVRNEFAKIKNITLESDSEKINKQMLKLHATVELEKVISRSLSNERLNQMDVYFNDRSDGVSNNNLALAQSKKLAIENFDNPYSYFTGYDKTQLKYADINSKQDDIFNSIYCAALSAGIKGISKLAGFFLENDLISSSSQSLINKYALKENNETKMLGNFIENLASDRCLSFEECVYMAEKECQKPSNAEKEKLYLKQRVEAAKLKYQNRPWWRIDYLLTNSDYNEYKKLEAEYNMLIAGDNVASNIAAPIIDNNSSSSISIGENSLELTAAYKKISDTYKSYVASGMQDSGTEFEEYKKACAEYEKIKNKNITKK